MSGLQQPRAVGLPPLNLRLASGNVGDRPIAGADEGARAKATAASTATTPETM